jgi:hypothetical protein
MDLITDLPLTASGHDAAVVFVWRLTKMVKVAPTSKTVTSSQMAKLFIDNVFRHEGMPSSIVSDRDPRFLSNFWQSVFTSLGTTLKFSAPFHPETDGQTERANRSLEEMLRNYVHPRQDDWDVCLRPVEFAYNKSQQASTIQTPFFLCRGWQPATPFDRAVPLEKQVPAADTFVQEVVDATAAAKAALRTAQQRQKAHADKGRRDARFAVGEEVLLSTRNLKLPASLSSKLSAKFAGPFPIVRSINDVAYELELPATVRVHPVFHVSLLKKFKKPLERGRYTRPGPVFADSQGRKYYRLETIVAKRRVGQPRRGRRATYEYLVKWEG